MHLCIKFTAMSEAIARGYVLDFSTGAGINSVPVSNQRTTTLTDDEGYFELPLLEGYFIQVCKPADYDYVLDEQGRPQFFWLYQPQGTPSDMALNYPGIDPTGPPADPLVFYLHRKGAARRFSAIFMGDIQPKNEVEAGYFRDLVARELTHQQARFIMPLGDLAWDDLSIHPVVQAILDSIGIPYFPVKGNHDINLRAPDRQWSSESFKLVFGPTYYAFNEGKVHFVVLDDIGYSGWDEENDCRGKVFGWIDDQQLDWLRDDLKLVPDDHLVFLATHIPIYTNIAARNDYRNVLNRRELFGILEQRRYVFVISAHTHFIEHVDHFEAGWMGKAPFPGLIAGAACGAWWKGPLDLDGLPVRMAMDGAPNGYFKFHFDDHRFTMDFCPAGASDCYQMGIRYPKAECVAGDRAEIVVNIYRATPWAEVSYQIDSQAMHPMKRRVAPDPYVDEFIRQNREAYPDWMHARPTAHLWVAPLPADLGAGFHRITVTAKEPDGQQIKSSKIFRVLNGSSDHSWNGQSARLPITEW